MGQGNVKLQLPPHYIYYIAAPHRYFVKNFSEKCIWAVNKEGRSIFIPRVTLFTNEEDYPFVMQRIQFPVRPAFAMTINKSQGQTLQRAGVYLSACPSFQSRPAVCCILACWIAGRLEGLCCHVRPMEEDR